MQKDCCFISFQTRLSPSEIPDQLNDPFGLDVPKVCKVAAQELQDFITENEHEWLHNFGLDSSKKRKPKGKMFGVLVVKNSKDEVGYLGTFSGRLADDSHHPNFVPSLFDSSTDNFFIDRGMTELTTIGDQIKQSESKEEIDQLKEERRTKSLKLQQQLFDNYQFLNRQGKSKSVCAIFDEAQHKMPPSGAGECAAPKLFHYAFKHGMEPLAIGEFWWGDASKSGDRKHKEFYPACQQKCQPILDYMLEKDE